MSKLSLKIPGALDPNIKFHAFKSEKLKGIVIITVHMSIMCMLMINWDVFSVASYVELLTQRSKFQERLEIKKTIKMVTSFVVLI